MARTRIAAPLAALGLVAVSAIGCSNSDDPYHALRQERRQSIPGTFGYDLMPASGFDPQADPELAYEELPGAGTVPDVALALARVSNELDGTAWGPAWVYITHGLCYFTAKGDFASPARSGDDDACTRNNMLVQVVDAGSGRFVAVFDAYDLRGNWLPDRVGEPAQLAGTTRFQ